MINRIRHFLQDWTTSLSQYAGAYSIALCTTVVRSLYIYYEPTSPLLSEILLTCGIVFPLMITPSLISQITGRSHYRKNIGLVISLVLGMGFYFYIHHLGIFNDDYVGMQQHHLFIVLSYSIARGSLLGGILYSSYKTPLLTRGWMKELCIHVVIAGVSSLILRGGLSASIGSVDYLFDINIYYKRYQYIGVFSCCVVGVSIALTNLANTKKVEHYPTILRFFGLYIFLPLASIYAIILVSYGAKILITQTRPKGLISWMVIGYTIRCTIVYFFTYPLGNQPWIKKIHTGYFVSILLFLPLLIGAIRQRIAQYGITEPRYLIIMIAIWIAVVGIGSLLWKTKSWMLMIGGLLILAISSAYTPRSANRIALISQQSRLEQLLIQHHLFDGKNLTPQTIDTASLTGQDYTDMHQIGIIGSYLAQSHGKDTLAYLYEGTTGFENIKNNENRDIYQAFLESLGYTGTFDQWNNPENDISDDIFFNIYHNNNNIEAVNIQHYTSFFSLNTDQKSPQTVGAYTIKLEGTKKEKITIQQANKKDIILNLYDYKDELYTLSLNTNTMPIIRFDGGFIMIENLNGSIDKQNNTISIGYYEIMIFLK